MVVSTPTVVWEIALFALFADKVGLNRSTQVLHACRRRAPESYRQYAQELLAISLECDMYIQCAECLVACGLMD